MAKNKNRKTKGAALEATPAKQSIKLDFTNNTIFNQRLKFLDYLLERGSITTSEAREKLDIYSPPARAFELRQAGYLLNTVWDNWTSEHGIKHRIARYVLTQKTPVERDNESEAA